MSIKTESSFPSNKSCVLLTFSDDTTIRAQISSMTSKFADENTEKYKHQYGRCTTYKIHSEKSEGLYYKTPSNFLPCDPNKVLKTAVFECLEEKNPISYLNQTEYSFAQKDELEIKDIFKSLTSLEIKETLLFEVPSDLTENNFPNLEFLSLQKCRIEPQKIVDFFQNRELTLIVDAHIGPQVKELLGAASLCHVVYTEDINETCYKPVIHQDKLAFEEFLADGKSDDEHPLYKLRDRFHYSFCSPNRVAQDAIVKKFSDDPCLAPAIKNAIITDNIENIRSLTLNYSDSLIEVPSLLQKNVMPNLKVVDISSCWIEPEKIVQFLRKNNENISFIVDSRVKQFVFKMIGCKDPVYARIVAPYSVFAHEGMVWSIPKIENDELVWKQLSESQKC